jgi:dipeptidyl aminopeptidase/acylaminoacyl peptidase
MTTMTTRPTRTKRRTAAETRTGRKQAAKTEPITPEDLTKFIFTASPQISPDGSRIVFARKHVGEKNEYVTNLWIVTTDGRGSPRQYTSGGRDGSPAWFADGSRIAFISGRDKPKQQLYLINADGGEATALTDFPEGSIGEFRIAPDGRSIAVAFREQDPEWTEKAKKEREEKGLSDPPRVLDHWWYRLDGDGYFNGQRHALYLVDTETGETKKIFDKDTLGFFGFDFSPDSKKLVISTNREKNAGLKAWNDDLMIYDLRSKKQMRVPDLPKGPKASPRWSPDGKLIAYAGRVGTDWVYSVENLELWVCDPVKGSARPLTADADHCLMAVSIGDTAEVHFGPNLKWSPDSKRVFIKLGTRGESHIASVPATGGPITFHTNGEVEFDLGNIADDGKHIALMKMTSATLPEIHVGEVTGDVVRSRALSDFNGPLLKQRSVAPVTSHWVTSADGNKVQVWMMTPPGFTKNSRKKYPAVLEIHGGPHGQYGVGYFHEFQVLANAGYIVVFSNPRGSKGYGRDHTAAIKGQWGTADWTDLQAVIEFMQDRPSIDTKRMGVMGGSYGGYMTNWVIGHTDVFAGAITDRCVSNVATMGGTSDFIELPDDYFPGNHWDRNQARWEQSPMKHIGNAKTPTLIIHSEGDLRCNIEQAEQLFTALTLLKVPTKFIRYPRSTSHGLSRGGPPDMRLHRLHQILDWWGTYLSK